MKELIYNTLYLESQPRNVESFNNPPLVQESRKALADWLRELAKRVENKKT